MSRIIPIESVDDPRIAPYTRLKERDLAREGGRFIAEGELVVRRLLGSSFATESLLLATRRVEEIAPLVPPEIPIYAADASVVNQIVGFKFHSGVMAVGQRGGALSLGTLGETWGSRPLTVVICPEVANTENLGALVRISAAFGADAMILGERSCDPFYRQSIRVSMGGVFSLPIVQSADLLADLRALREVHHFQLAATVLTDDAEPLAGADRPARLALLLGNEAQGLAAEHVDLCDRKVTIPMSPGADSLNVSIAAAIMLYHFTQVTRADQASKTTRPREG